MIKIAIVDDHPAITFGISNMLKAYTDIVFTGTYHSAAAFMDALNESVPDILLLDIQMPEQSGDKAIKQILKMVPELHIIVFSNFDSPVYIDNMMRYGAKGYLLKSSTQEQIIDAIQKVYAGKHFITAELGEQVRQFALYKKRMSKANLSLTDREQQILQLVADGLTTRQIAQQLFLSFHTVENYRDNIMMKLDVSNTAALIKKAVLLNLIS